MQGIDQNSASLLLSIIGITNTFGRVVCGYVADFPSVDSLLLNNLCLVVSTFAVVSIPFCSAFTHYVVMSVFFGLAICKFFFFAEFIHTNKTIEELIVVFISISWLYFVDFHYFGGFAGIG